MPIYVYKCTKCDVVKETLVRRRISHGEVISCEKCGTIMQQQLTAPNVQFKGTGFYATDFKGK